ncbi:MAG: hypothetical protein HY752_03515 [Nitrospirae bacterium]|nr:hypothetical protein [Nitrospirota bacterium]
MVSKRFTDKETGIIHYELPTLKNRNQGQDRKRPRIKYGVPRIQNLPGFSFWIPAFAGMTKRQTLLMQFSITLKKNLYLYNPYLTTPFYLIK